MEHREIEHRLRALGSAPLPEHLTERPVGTVTPVTTTWSAGRRLGRRPLAAAAAVLAITATGGLAWAASGTSGSQVATAPSEQASSDVVPDVVADLVPDIGPPESRPAPAVRPQDGDDNDHDDSDVGDGDGDAGEDVTADDTLVSEREFPHLDDPCKGPPTFVTDPTDDPDVTRAEEAAEHARVRSQDCPVPADESADDDFDGDRPDHAPGPPDHAGRPDHAAGPPDHAGRPDHTPGPPDHAGRPDHTPGPPDHGPPTDEPGERPTGDD